MKKIIIKNKEGLAPLEAKFSAACRGHECQNNFANSGINNVSRELPTGFTLIEIIVSMAIVLGVALLVGLFGISISKFSNSFNSNIATQEEMVNVLETISLEIRSMEQSSAGSYPIDSAASSSFSFYSDIDGDGLFERIRYFASSTTLEKGVLKPSGNPLSYNNANEIVNDALHSIVVSSSTPIFSYYDSSFTGSDQPLGYPINISSIRIIKIALSANQSSQGQPLSFTIYSMPRNLKNN